MTRDQLEELVKRLEYATRDVVTGERLDAGVYGHAPIEDLEEAAALLRSLLAQEPVAWCHLEQWKSGQYWPDDCFGSQRLEGTVPLYAAPVPAVDPEWKEAVIDKLIVSCIYRKEHETNPEKAINDLLEWEVTIALDPSVSSKAQALIDMGRPTVEWKAEAMRLADEMASTNSWTYRAALAAHLDKLGGK
jgi:hypothetical protein